MAIQPTSNPLKRGLLPAADRARLAEAHVLMQQSRLSEAEPLLRQVLLRFPASFDGLHSLGLFALKLGRQTDGIELLRSALVSDPQQPDALINLGKALHQSGEPEAALACVDMALGIKADDDVARLEGAGWLVALGRAADARRMLEPLQRDAAVSVESFIRAGRAALVLHDDTQALHWFERAAAAAPNDPLVLIQLGETQARLGRMADAAAAFAQALERDGSLGRALHGHGHALMNLGEQNAALVASSKAVLAEPGSVDTWNLHGAIQMNLRRHDQACESFRQALRLDPNHRAAVSNFANSLQALQRYEDAALVFERLLAIWPDCEQAKGRLLHCKMQLCDWLNHDALLSSIESDVDRGIASAEPFGMQAYFASPARLQTAARAFAASAHPARAAPHAVPARVAGGKIRIGYVSGEFRQQATSILLVRLLELHDRTRFDVFAFDNGRADQSAYRSRVERAVTELVPIGELSDQQALASIQSREIDILVNLNGYFGLGRSDLFSLRPAPVQVSFLGFPGTLGTPYIDYLIADRIVIPPDQRNFYDEAVVQLPDSYQPNDALRAVPVDPVFRRDHGLPETGFVFCCFNSSYKITPAVFQVWMNLLASVPGSVLWLLRGEEAASANLILEAQWQGIEATRLIFAPFLSVDQHLSRLRLADLVLDTLPYNAHTTGSDALWVGVPVVTCLGQTFPGRVGASLLDAVGLPGLITHSLVEYEALALRLATSPAQLADWRAQLNRKRALAPLFDSDRYRRHLEAAFGEMHRRALAGLQHSPFEVQAFEPSPTAATPTNGHPNHEPIEAQAV